MAPANQISTSTKITNFVAWPIQKKGNFIRLTLPIITCVATNILANNPYYAFLIAGITLASSELIFHQINKRTKKKIDKQLAAFEQLAQQDRDKPKPLPRELISATVPKRALLPIRRTSKSPQNGLLPKVKSRAARLLEISKKFVYIGKLLADKERKEKYEFSSLKDAFNFFEIDRDIIDDAWRKFPNEDQYSDRLDFLSDKIKEELKELFNKIKNDFNFQLKIMSKQTPEEIIRSLNVVKS